MRAWLLVTSLLAACGGSPAAPDAPGGGLDAGAPDGGAAGLEWPNAESSASSDPWLPANHERIRVLRPRILVLNFVNAKTNEEAIADVEKIFAAIAEGSRWHGYDDASAEPMVQPVLAKAVDLRDVPPPAGHPWNNSSLYPREEPPQGYWGFDYAALFGAEFAAHYGLGGRDLCQLVEDGEVHEVWAYVDGDLAGEASMAEILELKPRYDETRARTSSMDYCAGNGCFDKEDIVEIPAHCTRTVRIASINHTRGVGCFLENLTHGFEWTANYGVIPYLQAVFPSFGDFNLDEVYGTPFDSWYACPYDGPTCITYTAPQSLDWDIGTASGSIDDYTPACGQGHVPPNGRGQYDYGGDSPAVVLSTCRTWRQTDEPELFQSSDYTIYDALAPDCGGAWHVWWFQNFPGYDSPVRGPDDVTPMLSWWPFLYY